jgi:ribonuclease HI
VTASPAPGPKPGAPDDELIVHIDGASRGNPGEAAYGVHVSTAGGAEVTGLYGYLGRASNNVAEYQALLHALRWAAARGARRLRIYSDSELVVKQMEGTYRVKHPDMVPLHREARGLVSRFDSVKLAHVRREENREADRLANLALDERGSKLE